MCVLSLFKMASPDIQDGRQRSRVDLNLSNLNNFHSLEVGDRVSETQLQVGENSD